MSTISKAKLNMLMEAAGQASRNAYAPYSDFPVGAALLAEDDDIYIGCNVENASFGLTNCAERSAIFSAVADGRGPGDFVAIVIHTPGDRVHPPCGACRQVLAEFLPPDGLVYSTCDHGEMKLWSIAELLPDTFSMPE